MEVWKSIEDYEGLYEISNLGNVKSLNYKHTKKEGLLSKCNNMNGYLTVNLFKNRKVKTRRIHQLVALAFLNHKPCGYELVVNHINHIKTDNRLENLEIVTHRENSNKKHIKSFSQYTGVYWCKRTNKWLSQITINKKRNHLGYFDTEIEASEHYENALKSILNKEEISLKKPVFSSKYKGVCWYKKRNKWISYIKINDKRKYLGYFNTELEAYNAIQTELLILNK